MISFQSQHIPFRSQLTSSIESYNWQNYHHGVLSEKLTIMKFPTFSGICCSLLCSQEPATGPYLVYPTSNLFKIHCNNLLPSVPFSSKWFIPFRLSKWNAELIYHLPMCATYPTHLIPFYIWWRVQIIKLISMQRFHSQGQNTAEHQPSVVIGGPR